MNKLTLSDLPTLEKVPNSQKVLARKAVFCAIRRGDMKPAGIFTCLTDFCPNMAVSYHHYKGYAKENHLVVKPLCQKHHVETIGYLVDLRQWGGERVRLSKNELRLLIVLVKRGEGGMSASRKTIVAHLVGVTRATREPEKNGAYARNIVSRLRRKIGSNLVETVKGAGYRIAI